MPAMLEETAGVPIGDRRDRHTHRLDRGLAGSDLGFMQKPLDLREGFFDRVEVRGVGWQVHKLSSSLLDQLLDPLALVSGEVVHHHELPGPQAWSKYPLYIGLEDRSGGGPSNARQCSISSTTMLSE